MPVRAIFSPISRGKHVVVGRVTIWHGAIVETHWVGLIEMNGLQVDSMPCGAGSAGEVITSDQASLWWSFALRLERLTQYDAATVCVF